MKNYLKLEMSFEIYRLFKIKCIEEGATVVGGCCGTTSGHIEYLANYLKKGIINF